MISSPVWTQIEASSKLWCDKVPEPIRFVTAAGLGNILFFHIDRAFYESIVVPFTKGTHQLFQKNKETISFFFSYLIQVGFQHFLNAVLVYGLDTISTLEKYVDTLILSYSSYSVSLIGSTLGNALLISRGVSKNVAFWSTIVTFGMVNFFLLRFLIGGFGSSSSGIRGDEEKEEDKKMERRKLDKMKGETVQRQWNSRLGGRRNNTKSLGMVGVRGGGGEEGACTLPRNVFVSTVRWINACRGDVDFMVNLVTDLGPGVSYNVRNE